MGRRRKNENDEAVGCVVHFLFTIFLMPIVGLFMINSENPDTQKLGRVLLIVGSILWVVCAVINSL